MTCPLHLFRMHYPMSKSNQYPIVVTDIKKNFELNVFHDVNTNVYYGAPVKR